MELQRRQGESKKGRKNRFDGFDGLSSCRVQPELKRRDGGRPGRLIQLVQILLVARLQSGFEIESAPGRIGEPATNRFHRFDCLQKPSADNH